MRRAYEGYRLVTPQIEYGEKLTLHLGGKTIEALSLGNLHSAADTAVWLPQERILFAASIVVPNSRRNIRATLTTEDMLPAIRMMKSLNPEIVVAGHGVTGTTQIFDDAERYYAVLVERVGNLVRQGKSLDQIKEELQMPEYDNWVRPERAENNIEAAYRTVTGGN